MFKISTDKKVLEGSTGSKFINKSGVYDVTINFAAKSVSVNGSESISFNVTHNGETQTFYGPVYKKNNGEPNNIGITLYSQLGVLVGLDDGDQFTVSEEEHPVGRDQKPKMFEVLDEVSGAELKMQIKAKYSKYQGAIREAMEPVGFFNLEGFSADEVVNEASEPKKLALVMEKYADVVLYQDDLTADEVEEWRKNGYGKGTKAPSPKTSAANKTGGLFKK